jgi:hypothetical protein
MKVLFRTMLALTCLLFAGYWFTRPGEPIWAIQTKERIVGFSADSASFWTFSLSHDDPARTAVLFHQYRTADGVDLKKYAIPFDGFLNNCHTWLSRDGSWLSCGISKSESNASHRAAVLNTKTGETLRIPYLSPMPSEISPTGRWLYEPYGGELNDIYSRSPSRKILRLDDLRAVTGETGRPSKPVFSPDDRHMAVVWNDWAMGSEEKNKGSLCLYSTENWKPIRVLPFSERGIYELSYWTSAGLYYRRSVYKKQMMTAASPAIFMETLLLPNPTREDSRPFVLVENDRTVDDSRRPEDGYDYRGFGGAGEGWYAVTHFRSRPHPAWLLDFKKRFPSLASFVDSRWPQGAITYHLYDSSTKQPRGRFPYRGIEEFRFSPDGRWVAAVPRPGDQLAVYTTSPLSTWAGYVAIGMAVLFLAGNPARFWPQRPFQTHGDSLTSPLRPIRG